MSTFRERMLASDEPLDAHDVAILEDWLRVLGDDVATFGATDEDRARMQAIAERIARERGLPALDCP